MVNQITKIIGWREKTKAALMHLLASAGVAAGAGLLVFVVWYPYPYGDVAGGHGLFRLLVSVDVVMGPLLTLVVFNRAKPRRELWRDLSLIVLMQMGALAYGLHAVYQVRPVYLVHEVDRFRVVSAADITPEELKLAPSEFQQLPLWGIQTIGLRLAKDGTESLLSLQSALAGRDISFMPQRWQALSEANREEMRQRGRTISYLRSKAPNNSAEIDALLKRASVNEQDLIALPLVAKRDDWCIVLKRSDLTQVGYLPIEAF